MKYIIFTFSVIFITYNVSYSDFVISKNTFHRAAEIGDKESVKLFINKGLDVNLRDDRDLTPIHWAASRGFIEIVKILFENGADINAKSKKNGLTPLIAASYSDYYGNKEVVEFLLNRGANINEKDIDDNTALHISISYCNLPIFTLLIKHGIDVYIKNKKGETPLDLAKANKNNYKCIEVSNKFYKKNAFIDVLEYETLFNRLKYLPIFIIIFILIAFLIYRKKSSL